jgi:hypothetical protein
MLIGTPRCENYALLRCKSTSAILGAPTACVGKQAIHPDAFNAGSHLDRFIKSSRVDNLFWIEENKIGIVAYANQPALGEAESLRGHAGHLMNCFRK